jgi:hypothetical protein
MVGRPGASLITSEAEAEWGQTIFPNVFLVGDTNSSGFGVAGVSQSAFDLADILTDRD